MMNSMLRNVRVVSLSAMAVALFVVSATAFAAMNTESTVHDGNLVSITGDKLVMTNKEGQEHAHTLTADAKLTLDGKACSAAELKPGTRIRVTTQGPDNGVANGIEGLERNLDFASDSQDGTVVSITDNKLVMTGLQGQEDQTYILNADAKISCDGKPCQASDLKPGMRIRVTSERKYPHNATRIQALDKNPEHSNN